MTYEFKFTEKYISCKTLLNFLFFVKTSISRPRGFLRDRVVTSLFLGEFINKTKKITIPNYLISYL